MKAIVYTKFGSPEVLHLEEVEKPIPADNEVLIKVHAASINSWDWDLLRGKPRIYRLLFGLFKPKYKTIGCDVAGHVEAVGRNVKQFKPGDEVFGDLCESGWGGFAEYVCARENAISLKPAGMTFEQAAATPQAGVLALQGLRDKRQVVPGLKVLINGAGGGLGSFAIQIAKFYGAEVTGVDKAEKFEFMRSLGADYVIDYAKEDFTKNGKKYDLILDVIAYHSIFDYKKALNSGGNYIMIGGSVARIFQLLFLGPFISTTTSKKMSILVHKPNKELDFLKELFTAGKVVPSIDKQFKLTDTRDAFRFFGKGLACGKVVITVD